MGGSVHIYARVALSGEFPCYFGVIGIIGRGAVTKLIALSSLEQ